MGVHSVLDLLRLYPRRIHDRTAITPLSELEVGTETTVFGTVVQVASRSPRPDRKSTV